MKYLVIICIAIITAASPAIANEFQLATDIGANARQIAMGSIEGFTSDASTIFENPAGLYQIDSQSASFFTATFLNEVNYNNLAYARKTKIGNFGVGYMNLSIPDNPITRRDNSGEHLVVDTFNFTNWVLKATYQKSFFSNVHFGISLNTYGQTLDNSSGTGHNFDTGLIIVDGKNTVAFSVKNLSINQNISFDDGAKEQLTTQYLASVKREINKEFAIYGQYKLKENNSLLAAALTYTPRFAPYCELIGGYRQLSIGNIDKTNMTLGLSLNLNKFKVGYSYEASEYSGNNGTNYFSVAVEF